MDNTYKKAVVAVEHHMKDRLVPLITAHYNSYFKLMKRHNKNKILTPKM